MDKNRRISRLIASSLLGQLAADGQKELDEWISASPTHRRLYDELAKAGKLGKELERLQQIDSHAALQEMDRRIKEADNGGSRPTLHLVRWLSAAAVVMLIVGVAYIYFHRGNSPRQTTIAQATQITHGTTCAYVYLDDGEEISLGSDINADRQRLNRISHGHHNGLTTMRTPRGGDPARQHRSVAQRRERHFLSCLFRFQTNINAYDASNIRTTLFTGCVAVSATPMPTPPAAMGVASRAFRAREPVAWAHNEGSWAASHVMAISARHSTYWKRAGA